jgi:hypothetical protein
MPMHTTACIVTATVRAAVAVAEIGSMNQWSACAPTMSKAPAVAPRLNDDVVFMTPPITDPV